MPDNRDLVGSTGMCRANMAVQCLDFDQERVAVLELSDNSMERVTYGALARRAEAFAKVLAVQCAAGDRIGVLLGQSVDCLAAHLAIWKLGAISVPLFKLFQRGALESRIADSGTRVVVTDEEGASLVSGLAEPILMSVIDLQSAAKRADVGFANVCRETPAILIYTSGTTGAPKGALHGHGVLAGHLPGVAMSHNHLSQEGDVLWTPADWAWIGGLFDVALAGLALGVPVVAHRADKFSPEVCVDICARANVRNVFLPPTALRMLKAAGAQIDGVRSVASGGEPLGAEMLAWGREAFGVTINEFYGQTECNMVASSCAQDFAPVAGCIGKAVPGFEVAVLDETGAPTAQEGDIAVHKSAPSMMLGYWNNPEATAKKFRGDWMLTGDRGIWEGEFLRFVGREDDVITSSGYRIGPAEIEDCLLTHPSVATCGVVGKPDALRTQIVKAYVVCKEGHSAQAQDLQDWVKARLARHSYPREVEFVASLPMTVTGKVIRKELRRRAQAEGTVL